MKLTDKEWDRIAQIIRQWERDHNTPFTAIMDAINAVLAKRNVAQPIPTRHFDWAAWLDGREEDGPFGNGATEADVFNCMRRAYKKASGFMPYDDGLTATAQVLLVALRGPVTAGEYELWKKTPGVCPSLKAVIEYRIDRIMRPKKQTPVERVRHFLSSISAIDLNNSKYLDAATTDLLSLVEKLEEHHE